MYKRSIEDPVGFWSDIARTFHWCAPLGPPLGRRFAAMPLPAP